ncbi:helix-turn-helix transcriptional regulator [Paeniglutamicibacter kerguelensis]|uniref:ATP/maltotriose-dependent transcriptional regulator MalT n=1 Tax=Paeniglutamicibacter kerguelensis TaxID=254788 RepID=A0ABS4XI08_9MICC|nr:LuxR C-terminal-related transcriptional regulator [Paeniglutamicibacter kerguelensis]MBP2388101.1 ATP/maltotriose-dependent transcriptional regulator MalT [Paeniglutamicibacter kerguelensis]
MLAAGRAKSTAAALVKTLPSLAGFIVAGRYQPFAALRDLQAAGVLAELRTADLSFTRAELDVLVEHHECELDDSAAQVLLRRTAGWATALTLAVPWLKGRHNANAAVTGFDGDHRAVADYLVSEVLESLSVEERSVLSRTAIRSDVPFELAFHLAGMPNTGELLHHVAQRNSLLVEDSDGYHYHPVLLSFLQADARRKDAEAFAAAHASACRWFSAQEDATNALEEAIASARPTTIQQTIEHFGLELILAGETDLVTRAAATLPAHCAPVALLATNLLLEAPYFADVTRTSHLFLKALKHDTTDAATQDQWLAAAIAVHCLDGRSKLQLAERVERLRKDDISALRRESLALDLLAETAEAWCIGQLGESADGLRMLREVGISADRAGYTWLTLLATELGAQVAALSGQWEKAAAFEDEITVRVLDGPRTQHDWVRSAATIMSAARSFRRCEQVPLEELDEIITADAYHATHGTLVPAIALRSFPDLDSEANPRVSLETVDRLLRDHGDQYPRVFAPAALRVASLHLKLDGRSEALESAEEIFNAFGENTLESETVRFALAFPSRTGDAAEEQLLSALDRRAQTWHAGAPVGAWILLARAAELQGRGSEADLRLAKALKLAHRFDAVQPFAARGGEGAAMLGARIGRLGHLDEFAAHIHRRVRMILPEEPVGATSGETLTPREHEILKELPVHQSVAEIARKLTLSVNTVKTHLRSIYQKLGVSDRSEAVSVAQNRGLL